MCSISSKVVGARDTGAIFRPPCTPPALPTGILYSPQFRSHQETKMAAVRTTINIYGLTEK